MKEITISLKNNDKAYFLGDFHLGSPDKTQSKKREYKILSFLSSIESDLKELFLLGDIFDFWYEYKEVVPKGFTRFLGKISELSDKGVNIHLILGNHDMWVLDYFQKELGINVYDSSIKLKLNNNLLLVGHGDGIGEGDLGYKLLKLIFKNKILKFLFRWIHPDIGVKLGIYLSKRKKIETKSYSTINNERIYNYCKKVEDNTHYDYYIFGHSHQPLEKKINNSSRYINVGDWIKNSNYLEVDNKQFQLKIFRG